MLHPEELEDDARFILHEIDAVAPDVLRLDLTGGRSLLRAADGFALLLETDASARYCASGSSSLAEDVRAVGLDLLRRLRLPEADAVRLAAEAARAVRRVNAPADEIAAVVGPTVRKALRIAARRLRSAAREMRRSRPVARPRPRRARAPRPPASRVRIARPRSSSPRPRAARRTVSTPKASAASPPPSAGDAGPSGDDDRAPRAGERGRP